MFHFSLNASHHALYVYISILVNARPPAVIMGKCVFNPRWLDRGEFPLLDWVTNSAQGKYHVHCPVCDCELNIGSGGISTLKVHMDLDKHTNNVERLAKHTNSMRNYVSMTPSGSPGNSSPAPVWAQRHQRQPL